MSTKEKLILLTVAVVVIVVGILASFLISRSSTNVSTIFGKIDSPDIISVNRLQSKKLSTDFKTSEESPKTANVFKISEKEISRDKAIAIAAKFGFKGKPRGALTLTWKQKNKILDVDLDNRRLNFKDLNIKPLQGKYVSEKLAETATKFLKQKGLNTNELTADTKNLQLFEVRGTGLGTTSDSSKPVFIEIGFNRELNGFSLFYQNPTEAPILVLINNKGQIFSISYKFTDINEKTSGTYPLVDIRKISTEEIGNFGDWVFPQTGDGIFEPQLIKSIVIEDFSLVYLDDQNGDFVQPIYILRGFGTVGKESISVVIYYPALQEEWLK